MNKKKVDWYHVNGVVGILSGLLGIVEIFTSIKSAKEQEAYEDARLEAKYGLKQLDTYKED